MDALVGRLLASSNASERALGESILFRMDRSEAMVVLQAAGGSLPSAARLREDVASGAHMKNLRPTGSAQGDRYYVQADWSLSDGNVTACLSKLFNESLINDRTLPQEQAMMAGRKQRLVYWYDKNWALDIADRITGCGGRASFVAPKP